MSDTPAGSGRAASLAKKKSAHERGESGGSGLGDSAGSSPMSKSQQRMTDKISQLKGEVAAAERKATRGKVRMDTGDGGGGDTDSKMRAQIKSLKEDLERRQSSYIRRERDYRTRIELLEGELNKAKRKRTQQLEADDHMEVLRDMHTAIQSNIENVQEQTSRILAENERDLLRAFRARLFDVQTELEKEKARAEDGAAVWIEKNRQLDKELDWAKEMADRLDRHNQALTRENGKLKTKYKTQEDDRNYLIQQLVASKKDNQRLRQELTRVKSELEASQKMALEAGAGGFMGSGPTGAGGAADPAALSQQRLASLKSRPPNAQEENRYKDIIRRLKKLLEVERKNLRQVRTAFAQELQQRTELEIFLRQCIEDVKHDISRRRNQLMSSTGSAGLPPVARPGSRGADGGESKAGAVPLSSFASTDRERVMELLLSQERVISLLYSRTFPPRAPPEGLEGGPLEGDAAELMREGISYGPADGAGEGGEGDEGGMPGDEAPAPEA